MSSHILVCLVLITAPLIALSYPYWQKQISIKHWYKKLALKKHSANYEHLFQNIDGFALSQKAREPGNAIEYTYGEIEFIPFIALLSLAKPNSNTIFYDLGSGIGKAVLACAMVFNVQKSCGIELLNLLHETALAQRDRIKQLTDYSALVNRLHFINADFLHTDFSDATLVFINATAFFGETWKAISLYLKQLKPGTTIITTSKRLPGDVATLLKETNVQMSWGPVKAYVQQRV